MAKNHLGKNDVWVEITPQEQKRFNSVIDEMVKKTGKTFQKVVRNIARDTARSCLKKTAIAPKQRSNKVKGRRGYYWAKLKNRWTGQEVIFPVSEEKATRYGYPMLYDVKKRGFMKSGWASVLYKLGIKNSAQTVENPKWGLVKDGGGNSSNFMITVFNEVPFITEWDAKRNRWKTPQHIVERSVREVTEKWEKVLREFANKDLTKSAFREL